MSHNPANSSISYCINEKTKLIYSYNKINNIRILINVYTIVNKVIIEDKDKLETIYEIKNILKTSDHIINNTCTNVSSQNIKILLS